MESIWTRENSVTYAGTEEGPVVKKAVAVLLMRDFLNSRTIRDTNNGTLAFNLVKFFNEYMSSRLHN